MLVELLRQRFQKQRIADVFGVQVQDVKHGRKQVVRLKSKCA
jgi:hypothetical protein